MPDCADSLILPEMSDRPRYLTKSRFKLAVECPRKLYYTGKPGRYPDVTADDDFLAMLAEGGYQVGALARLAYPVGIEIRATEHAAAHALTQVYLQRDNVVLFEAAILVDGFFVRIDILVKRGVDFELIEVKAKSYDADAPELYDARGNIRSAMLPYVQDVAFQAWVLGQARPNARIASFLVMPDKARRAPVAGVNQMFQIGPDRQVTPHLPPELDGRMLAEGLLAKVEVTGPVAAVLSSPLMFPGGPLPFAEALARWAADYAADQPGVPAIGAQCAACQFDAAPGSGVASGFRECWKEALGWQVGDFAGGTVLDLYNSRRKQAFIDRGIYKLSQVTREDLGDFSATPDPSGLDTRQRQWMQINGLTEGDRERGYYFDAALVGAAIAGWRFPCHFIDFETAAMALPFHAGMRPYESVAFQFSHHVLEADGALRHAGQFLCAVPGVFPNYDFVRALRGELGNDEGTVFMWSHHENTILTQISAQLAADTNPPTDAETLEVFIAGLTRGGKRAMVDLCNLAAKSYFHPDTGGSSSIKKVLPATIKSSRFLQKRYGQPVYGAPGGIHSLNYASTSGFTWISPGDDGAPTDPYAKLKDIAREMLPAARAANGRDDSVIAEGGAAATAYARLQFEQMDDEERSRITAALLRYCELDTLAMAMIVEAWMAECRLE